MKISREELCYDFKGAHFNLEDPKEREILGWIFSQFLYGEVTGIQCGYWLYRAPHLNAATFLAKQAGEELSHVRKFLRVLSLLKTPAQAAHPAIRFLSSGMMGGLWGEHVAIEMALGEGLVLGIFYAMRDTVQDPAIQKILDSAALEEEKHVEFGERETEVWLSHYPGSRKLLLGLALVQVLALQRVKKFVSKRIFKEFPDHLVFKQFDSFYDHLIRTFVQRIERLGLAVQSIEKLSFLEKCNLVLGIPFRIIYQRFSIKGSRLTDSYLNDPLLKAELQRSLHGTEGQG